MTADWDAVLAEGERLRDAALALAAGKNHNGFSLVEFNNWLDDNAENLLSAALRERESAKEIERLREALRSVAIISWGDGESTCEVCENAWMTADPEAHKSGCLAAEKGEQT